VATYSQKVVLVVVVVVEPAFRVFSLVQHGGSESLVPIPLANLLKDVM
jgi:hypothetical protein